jgi:hypothetical protein
MKHINDNKLCKRITFTPKTPYRSQKTCVVSVMNPFCINTYRIHEMIRISQCCKWDTSPSAIRVINSRMVGLVEQVASMGDMRNA